MPAWLAPSSHARLRSRSRCATTLRCWSGGSDEARPAGRNLFARSRPERVGSPARDASPGRPGSARHGCVRRARRPHRSTIPGPRSRWRQGRSLALWSTVIAFWALGEMVKARGRDPRVGWRGRRRSRRSCERSPSSAVLDGGARPRSGSQRHLRPLVGARDSRGRALRRRTAVRRRSLPGGSFFEGARGRAARPILVFEDVHWADDALLDFIDVLADRAGAAPTRC